MRLWIVWQVMRSVTCSHPTTNSLRSKRFQSSYCAKVRAEAKKRLKGEGEGRRGNSFSKSWGLRASGSFIPFPLPRHSFFLLLSQFSWRTSRGNACYAGYTTNNILMICKCIFTGVHICVVLGRSNNNKKTRLYSGGRGTQQSFL